MLFLTEYRFRSGMDRAQVQRVMDLFGKRGRGDRRDRPLRQGRRNRWVHYQRDR